MRSQELYLKKLYLNEYGGGYEDGYDGLYDQNFVFNDEEDYEEEFEYEGFIYCPGVDEVGEA